MPTTRVPDPAIYRAIDLRRRLDKRQSLGRGDLVRELAAPPLHQLGDPIQDLAPVHRCLADPAGHGAARATDRIAQVLARGSDRVGQRLSVRRADDVRAPRL
jgi:hypothetical protein